MKKDSSEYPVRGGRFKKVLSTDLEKLLSTYLQERGSRGFGLTPSCPGSRISFEIAERNNFNMDSTLKQERLARTGLDHF
jgi:surfactin synthase thioesterase subunit